MERALLAGGIEGERARLLTGICSPVITSPTPSGVVIQRFDGLPILSEVEGLDAHAAAFLGMTFARLVMVCVRAEVASFARSACPTRGNLPG